MSVDLALGIYTAPRAGPEQPLTSLDVEAAHRKAGELLAVEVPAERAVWTAHVVTLLLGGAAPAIGALVFGWTFGPMLLAIAIDDAAAVLADLARMLLGERAFTREIDRRRLAANTWIIAGLARAADRIPLGWRPHRPHPRPLLEVVYFYGGLGACITGTFLGFLLVFVDVRDIAGWPLLFLPLATRLLPAVRDVRHARASRPSPAIMPSAWLLAIASVLAVAAYVSLSTLLEPIPGELAYAAVYFAICALFAALLTATRRGRESLLREFAARDIAPVIEALRAARYGVPGTAPSHGARL